jgi:hypothetical protein
MKLLVPAFALLALGQSATEYEIVSRSFDNSGFHAVDNAGPYDVTVRRGTGFSIAANGPREIIDRMEVSVKEGTLRLGWRNPDEHKRYWNKHTPRTTVAVTLPTLDAAILSGAGKLDIDRVDGRDAELAITGAGNLTVGSITASRLSLALRGAGKIVTSGGTADQLTATLAGAGNVDMTKLTARNAKLDLAGVGNIKARASGRAEIRAGGMGNAKVVGTTDCAITKTGMGHASCAAE